MGIKKRVKKSIVEGSSKSVLVPSDFVHLHNHTQYSILDGLTKVEELIEYIKSSGMKAVSITDHGTLSGWIEFYKTAKANGIKPVLGIETYMATRSLHDKDPAYDRARYHLILLAINQKGIQNLMRLSTIANLEGYYYYPRIDRETLQKYSDGLIVLSGCMGSELGSALKDNRQIDAEEIANWYKNLFKDRYYLEIQDHGHPDNPLHSKEQYEINKKIFEISNKLNIPCIVTSDAHYLKHDDQDAHEVLLCVGTGSYLADENRMSLREFPLHVEYPEKIIERWGVNYPELITNTKKIADLANTEFELGKILIPKFTVPKGESEKSYLHKLVWRGIAWRYGGLPIDNSLTIEKARKSVSKEIIKRVDYELGVIDGMDFNGYFLIIWDLIYWGKNQGIVFGPGRGSAAGAIVAFALRITEIDPIAYGLLFERFLNPDRISMPDIDIDIADDRRNEVIEYCREKYGEDRVANIITFGRMAARNAVRDTARVMQVPYAEADRLAKMIPPPVQGRHIPLAKSLKNVPELRAEYQNSPISKQVFDMAMKLEGTIRSHGVHAAGVVIAPDDIVTFVPLMRAQKQVVMEDGSKKDVIATQFSMNPIEDLGLLKMDFLGLSNLTIIKNCLRIIKKVYEVDIDIASIPIDDRKTYRLLQKGETTGVFQLESSGMKKYLRELKPTEFDDISAMCALYRPGPLKAGLVDAFIRRKNGIEQITVPHPKFKEALKSTYGTLVYQEQVMQISIDVCGFSGGEADTLRKAIGKKIREVMEKMKEKFIEGGVTHSGVPLEVMEKFWEDLLGFADYAFNKSHSACYGLIAYQTAYLKAHYPSAFMAALMTSDYNDTDRLAIEISECQRMGISVMSPDVNSSFHEFSISTEGKNVKSEIRFGLDAIKNVGKGAAEEIIGAREKGPFTSLDDFITRINSKIVNRKTWESLIKSGALDAFGERSALYSSLDSIISFANKIHKERSSAQVDLFNMDGKDSTINIPTISLHSSVEYNDNRLYLDWERELLGIYLSSHPLQDYDVFLSEQAFPISQINSDHDGTILSIGGSISDLRQITTKNGQTMAFIKLEDRSGEIEAVVFPSVYKDVGKILARDKVVTITGRVSTKDRNGNSDSSAKLLADSVNVVNDLLISNYESTGQSYNYQKTNKKNVNKIVSGASQLKKTKLYIKVEDESKTEMLVKIKSLLDQSKGDSEVVLVLGGAVKQVLKLPYKIEIEEELTRTLASLVGSSNVAVR